MRTYETLIGALTDLKDRGYWFDFKKEFSSLFCQELDLRIEPEKFNVDEYYRFGEYPDDNSIIYAISSTHGVKGVLIDAYGIYPESVSFRMAQRLNTNSNHTDKFEPSPVEIKVDKSPAMKAILVPFDFSSVAIHALSLAIEIALKTGIHVHILHVVELPYVQGKASVLIESFEESYKAQITRELGDKIALAINNITNKPILVTVGVSFGTVVHEIIDYAETREVDLIIAGSHGASGIREFAMGSNAEKISRKSTKPVLIIKEYHYQQIRSIVLSAELDAKQPVQLMDMTKKLQNIFGAVLHIHIDSHKTDLAKKPTHQQLDEIQDKFGFENVTWNFLNPSSLEESIVEFAELVNADMISISTQRRRAFSELLNGNIAKHLVNHSARMILTGAYQL